MYKILKNVRKAKTNRLNRKEDAILTIAIENPGTPLEKYLNYYVGKINPGYALLVTGDWGVGKTYQVRKALPDTHSHYLSLFGISGVLELENELISRMLPKTSFIRRIFKGGSDIKLSIGGFGELSASSLISLAKSDIRNDKPIIIDDLERSSLPHDVVMGILNQLVEHHKCRVVVIANDTKIGSSNIVDREKIFGQIIRVESEIESAYDVFYMRYAEFGYQYLSIHKGIIVSSFKSSGVSSLRVLKYIMENIGRLLALLDVEILKKELLVKDLVKLFSVLLIEAKIGNLNNGDFVVSNETDFISLKSKIASIQKKYGFHLRTDILSADLLERCLFYGDYDRRRINNKILKCPEFIETRKIEPWKIVYDFRSYSDDVVADAVTSIYTSLEKVTLVHPGEILHSLAALLFVYSIENPGSDPEPLVKIFDTYLDNLKNSDKFARSFINTKWNEEIFLRHQSIEYRVADENKKKFERLVKSLRFVMTNHILKQSQDAFHDIVMSFRVDPAKAVQSIIDLINKVESGVGFSALSLIDVESLCVEWVNINSRSSDQLLDYFLNRIIVNDGKERMFSDAFWYSEMISFLQEYSLKGSSLHEQRVKHLLQRIEKLSPHRSISELEIQPQWLADD